MSAGVLALGRRLRAADLERRRRRIRIPFADQGAAVPTVYVLVPDDDAPSGGVRVMYRHVDVLNASGIRARVLHQRPGFRCSWFDHDTLTTSVAEARIGPSDVLVVSELDVDLVVRLGRPVNHVVLNQSGFLTWSRMAHAVDKHYRTGPGLLGIVTVSEYARELLAHAFAHLPVERVRVAVDTERFRPPDMPPTTRRIAYLGRRGADEVEAALRIVGPAALAGWEVRRLDGLTHAQVADELRASTVFLTGSTHEGFGLPSAEAMACGAYVVGYDAFGGREFFDPRYCSPVPVADTLGLARALAVVLARERQQPGWVRAHGLLAAERIRGTYRPEDEYQDVVRAYRSLLRESAFSSKLFAT